MRIAASAGHRRTLDASENTARFALTVPVIGQVMSGDDRVLLGLLVSLGVIVAYAALDRGRHRHTVFPERKLIAMFTAMSILFAFVS